MAVQQLGRQVAGVLGVPYQAALVLLSEGPSRESVVPFARPASVHSTPGKVSTKACTPHRPPPARWISRDAGAVLPGVVLLAKV